MPKLNCIFCATPDIASKSLEYLAQNENINLSLVVSMPDRPSGRGKKLKSPDIIVKAKELGLNFLQTDNINKSDDFKKWSSDNDIDLIIVFAFSQFFGEKILNLPKLGCFNIHTSLLPKYRGAAPMQYALFNGDKSTGICIQRMVKKMDAGNILEKLKFDIGDKDNFGTLHEKFKECSPKLLDTFLNNVLNDSLSEEVQDESEASFSPSIPKEMTLINFEQETSENIFNKIRGLSPVPGAYCYLNGKRLKVYSSEISDIKLPPFQVTTKFNTLLIGTADGSIRLSQVQLEGKSKTTDLELINGFKNSKQDLTITSVKDK